LMNSSQSVRFPPLNARCRNEDRAFSI
jgi:hypothetical protein